MRLVTKVDFLWDFTVSDRAELERFVTWRQRLWWAAQDCWWRWSDVLGFDEEP